MDKRLSTVMGLALVFLGSMAMLFTLGLPFDGERGQTWRLWPLIVLTLGVVAGLIPFVVRQRWAGALFIPAAPILATGWEGWRWASQVQRSICTWSGSSFRRS